MKTNELDFIKDWFKSDLDIQIEVEFKGQKGIITLENNAYYTNGQRYKGDKRRIIYDDDFENSKIYDFLEENFKEYFYSEYDYDEVINFLLSLEENGFKLRVL